MYSEGLPTGEEGVLVVIPIRVVLPLCIEGVQLPDVGRINGSGPEAVILEGRPRRRRLLLLRFLPLFPFQHPPAF